MGCVVVWKEAHGQEKNTSYWKLLLWQKGVKLCTACWGNTKITNGDAGGVRYPACTLSSDGMIWGAEGALAPPGMSLGMKTTRHQLFWPRQKIAQIFSFNTEALRQRNWWKTANFPNALQLSSNHKVGEKATVLLYCSMSEQNSQESWSILMWNVSNTSKISGVVLV